MKATATHASATKPQKFATVTAPPAKPAKKAAGAPPAKKGKVNGGLAAAQAERSRVSNEIYQSKVVATTKETREGSFFGTVQKLAKKPIVLETLIGQVTKEVGKSLNSEKDAATVCRTRTRDGIKLGFLKLAK